MQTLLIKDVEQLTVQELSDVTTYLNEQYREGEPKVSDNVFDFVYMSALKERIPEHDLLNKVQPETIKYGSKGRIIHPQAMLSTDKAYTDKEVAKWLERVIKAGQDLGMGASDILIECSSKLDGVAGRYIAKTKQLFSRGDGLQGFDISHISKNGLVVVGDDTKDSVGEIVMKNIHFDTHFSKEVMEAKGEEGFANSRGFISGIANSDEIKPHAKKALDNGFVELVIYADMPRSQCNAVEFMNVYESLEDAHLISEHLLDGVIFDVVDERIKELLGETPHHPVWRLAKKRVNEVKQTKINNIRWQVGRTRIITPIIEIESVHLSGANITSITAHSLGYLKENGLGVGAVILAKRSGEVIPCLHLTKKRVAPIIPVSCPCCDSNVIVKIGSSQNGEPSEVLMCSNETCGGSTVSYFFHAMKRLGIDLFGKKACAKLVDNKVVTLEQIFNLNADDYIACGFGTGQASNFIQEIVRAKADTLNDSHLLAALGIHLLGRGSSEKILKHYKVSELDSLSYDDLVRLDGFADISAKTIISGLNEKADTLAFLLEQGFNLTHTSEIKEVTVEGNGLAGLSIVFTGTMTQGSRSDMSADAKSKGAIVQKGGVNGKTSMLVIGDKVGASKMNKAKELGVQIITEDEYNKRYG